MSALDLDDIAGLAKQAAAIARDMYDPEDWQPSPLVEALRRVAMLLREKGREPTRHLAAAVEMAEAAGQRH